MRKFIEFLLGVLLAIAWVRVLTFGLKLLTSPDSPPSWVIGAIYVFVAFYYVVKLKDVSNPD